MINEREKICPECNTTFSCCISGCWCAELPNIMPMDDLVGCYCPDCLKKIIDNKIQVVGR